MIKGIFKTLNPPATFLLLLIFSITIFLSMVILLILVILFRHRDTTLKVLFIFLNLTNQLDENNFL